MVRWEPDGEERLRKAAIELFLEHGYDSVTVAQIADRAGLTRRTFSRYFTDKRDVLFAGSDQLPDALARALRDVDADVPPFDAMLQALANVGGMLEERVAEHARLRQRIIAESPELQERGHAKFAAVGAALAAALRDRGADEPTSALLADLGASIFRRGFERWVDNPDTADLPSYIREAGAALRDAVEQSRL